MKIDNLCVLFDYDGLLVDTERVIFDALRDLFKSYDVQLTWDYYSRHIGRPVNEELPIFFRDHHLPVSYDKFVRDREQAVTTYIRERLTLMPGAMELLTALGDMGVRMAVASSGTRAHVNEGLERFCIRHYFEHVVCVEDVMRGKPHPDLVIEALSRMNVDSSGAMLLEDSPLGVDAANRASVYSIGILTSGMDPGQFSHARMILPNLLAFRDFLSIWQR